MIIVKFMAVRFKFLLANATVPATFTHQYFNEGQLAHDIDIFVDEHSILMYISAEQEITILHKFIAALPPSINFYNLNTP